jgi:hypothetical protein
MIQKPEFYGFLGVVPAWRTLHKSSQVSSFRLETTTSAPLSAGAG